MEDSGAILCQISSLKDMLDQVNQEIEADIQITREIEAEIFKCSEIESALAVRESELTKTLYVSHFEIDGFATVTAHARTSLNSLEKELCCLRMERDETLKRINDKRLEYFYAIYDGLESALAVRESELTKTLYVSHFEIDGFATVTAHARTSLNSLEKELCCLRMERDETLKRINDKREGFTNLCLEFQKDIDKGKNDELRPLLLEKEFLENEIHLLDKKNNGLKNSMLVFVEEILEELHNVNSALQVEIEAGKEENEKLLKDIDCMKTQLLSTLMIDDDHCAVHHVLTKVDDIADLKVKSLCIAAIKRALLMVESGSTGKLVMVVR